MAETEPRKTWSGRTGPAPLVNQLTTGPGVKTEPPEMPDHDPPPSWLTTATEPPPRPRATAGTLGLCGPREADDD